MEQNITILEKTTVNESLLYDKKQKLVASFGKRFGNLMTSRLENCLKQRRR